MHIAQKSLFNKYRDLINTGVSPCLGILQCEWEMEATAAPTLQTEVPRLGELSGRREGGDTFPRATTSTLCAELVLAILHCIQSIRYFSQNIGNLGISL